MLLQNQIDQETRLRFAYQDKLAAAQKDLEEVVKRCEETEGQYKHEICVLEKMLQAYKKSFQKVEEENEELCKRMGARTEKFVADLKSLETEHAELFSEIKDFKRENSKQEDEIRENLNRFREITAHFENMKEQFLLQQVAIGDYHEDATNKSKTISEMREQLDEKIRAIDEIQKLSATREEELNKNVDKLQDTLDGCVEFREALETKNKERENMIENLREENVKWKAEYESMKATLSVERDFTTDKVDTLVTERDEAKKKCRELMLKLKTSREREAELMETKTQYESQGNELFEENKTLREMVLDVENQNAWFTGEKAKLEEELASRRKEIDSLVVDLNNKDASLKQKTAKLSATRNELHLLQIDKNKGDEEKKEVETRLVESAASLQEENRRIKEFEERLIKCQFLFMENDKKYTELSEKCSQLENEKIEDKYRLSAQSEELENQKLEYAEQSKTNQLLQLEVKEASSRLEESTLQSRTTAENIKAMAADVRQEVDGYRQECERKEGEVCALRAQVVDLKSRCENGNKELSKTCEQLEAANSKNECLAETASKVAAEKQEYLTIIENFTKRESDLKTELDRRSTHSNESEQKLRDQKREFEQYKVNVENYDRLWQAERDQALMDLEDELCREQRLLDVAGGESFSQSPRRSRRLSSRSPMTSPT